MAKDWSKATDQEIINADLIVELGFTNLAVEEQQKISGKLTEQLQRGILVELMTKLSPEQRAELNDLVTQGKQSESDQYFQEKLVDYPEIVERR